MRAAIYEAFGRSDVLRVVDLERPEPGPGEVRVRVGVSGVNPTDWKTRSGSSGAPMPFPFQVPNQDGAGVIDALGDGVPSERLGQRVWLFLSAWRRPWGTAAQWTVLPADQAVPLPDGADMSMGAQLGVPALTAHRCLFADGPVDGRTVLVAGGAGAVGWYAIQLARRAGATVITTVSSEAKADLARRAGAHHVVNYREGDTAAAVRAVAPEGVHRVVEVALTTNLALDLAVVAQDAAIVTYAGEPVEPTLPVRALMTNNAALRFVLLYYVSAQALAAGARDVNAAIEAGDLVPMPVHRHGLDQIAAAHDAVEGGAVGKVLVDVDPEVV